MELIRFETITNLNSKVTVEDLSVYVRLARNVMKVINPDIKRAPKVARKLMKYLI